ncbi:MAG: hypothetical protein EA369_02520 [Bradymonadales bacterium]|nr:MAG: hypothetical protein EA369_02520 [Bradymonadales bacterium]
MRKLLALLLATFFLPLGASLGSAAVCPPADKHSLLSVFSAFRSDTEAVDSKQTNSRALQEYLELADSSMEVAIDFARQGQAFFDGPIEDERVYQHFSYWIQRGFSLEEVAALWTQARELLQASLIEWLEGQRAESPVELQRALQESAFGGMIGESELNALYAYLQAEPLIESILSDTAESQVLHSEWHALRWERGSDGRLRHRSFTDREDEKEAERERARLESERTRVMQRIDHSFDRLEQLNTSFGGINIDRIRRDAERERALVRWRLSKEPLTRDRFERSELHDYFDADELEATLVAMELKEIFQESYAARYALGWIRAAPNPADRAKASKYSDEISRLDQRLEVLARDFPEHVDLDKFYEPLREVRQKGGDHRGEQERENLEARLRTVFEAFDFDHGHEDLLVELVRKMSSRPTRATNDEWMAAIGRAIEAVEAYQRDRARGLQDASRRVGVGNTGSMGMSGRGTRSLQERRGYQSLIELFKDHGMLESKEAWQFLDLLGGSRLASLGTEQRVELEKALAPDVEPPSFWQRAVSTILRSEEALIESLANLTVGNALYYGGGVVGAAFGGGWEAGSDVGVQFIRANQRAANEGTISGVLNRVSPLRGFLASQLDQPHYSSIYGSTDDMASASLPRLALWSNPLNPVGEVLNLALEVPAAAFSETQRRLMGLSDIEYSAHKRAGGFARYTEGAFDLGLGALSLAIMAKTGGASAMSRVAMASRSLRVAGGMSLAGGVAVELRTTDEDFNWERLAENTVRGAAGSMLFMGTTTVMSARIMRSGHSATTARNVARSINIAQAQQDILETLAELSSAFSRLSSGEEMDTQELIGLAIQFAVGVYDVTDPSLGPVMARLKSQARAENTVKTFYQDHPDLAVSPEQRKTEADSLLRVERFVAESGIKLTEDQLRLVLKTTLQAHVQGRGRQNWDGTYPRGQNIRKSRILMEGYENAGLSREQALSLSRFVLDQGIAGDESPQHREIFEALVVMYGRSNVESAIEKFLSLTGDSSSPGENSFPFRLDATNRYIFEAAIVSRIGTASLSTFESNITRLHSNLVDQLDAINLTDPAASKYLKWAMQEVTKKRLELSAEQYEIQETEGDFEVIILPSHTQLGGLARLLQDRYDGRLVYSPFMLAAVAAATNGETLYISHQSFQTGRIDLMVEHEFQHIALAHDFRLGTDRSDQTLNARMSDPLGWESHTYDSLGLSELSTYSHDLVRALKQIQFAETSGSEDSNRLYEDAIYHFQLSAETLTDIADSVRRTIDLYSDNVSLALAESSLVERHWKVGQSSSGHRTLEYQRDGLWIRFRMKSIDGSPVMSAEIRDRPQPTLDEVLSAARQGVSASGGSPIITLIWTDPSVQQLIDADAQGLPSSELSHVDCGRLTGGGNT